MAFDPTLNETILFGGNVGGGGTIGDTWALAGGTWTDLGSHLTTAPAARYNAALAYDSRDQYLVLFGGQSGPTTYFNDTWVFNSSGWTQLHPSTAPTPRWSSMAFDPNLGSVVLFGGGVRLLNTTTGATTFTFLNDTWTYGAGTWTNVTSRSAAGPPAEAGGALAYDSADGYLVVYGGTTAAEYYSVPCVKSTEFWAYQNSTWRNLSSRVAQSGPAGPNGTATEGAAYDAAIGRLLVFGGTPSRGGGCQVSGETWTYANGTWANLTSSLPVSPSAREWFPMTYDIGASAAVLFGGSCPSGYLGDTWAFGPSSSNGTHGNGSGGNGSGGNGTGGNGSGGNSSSHWIEVAGPSVSPPTRAGSAMAYDPKLNETVLFGGYLDGGGAFGDTWVFGSGSWVDISGTLSASPSARYNAAFGYDAADGYLVLFGGRTATTYLNDTWTFTTSGWTQLHTSTAPSPRWSSMAYDPNVSALVLFGGGMGHVGVNYTFYNDTWSFSGGQWTNVTATVGGAPPGEAGGAIAYDPADGYLVALGGTTAAEFNLPANACRKSDQFWAFGSSRWTNLSAQGVGSGPAQTGGISTEGMVFDPALGQIVVFGGTPANAGTCYATDETWSYAHGAWTNLTAIVGTSPAARQWFPFTWDAGDQYALLHAGSGWNGGPYYGDTWALKFGGNLTGNGSGNGSGLLPRVSVRVSGSIANGVYSALFNVVRVEGVGPFSFRWTFGDGSPTGNGTLVSHPYTTLGTYEPRLTVQDAQGHILVVALPKIVVATIPVSSHPSVGRPSATLSAYQIDGLALAIAVVGSVTVWAALERRERRLRAEGLELIGGSLPPP